MPGLYEFYASMRSGRRGPEVPGRLTVPDGRHLSFNEVRAKRPGSTSCAKWWRRGLHPRRRFNEVRAKRPGSTASLPVRAAGRCGRFNEVRAKRPGSTKARSDYFLLLKGASMRSGRRGPEVLGSATDIPLRHSSRFNEVRAKRPGSTKARSDYFLLLKGASMRSGRRGPEVLGSATDIPLRHSSRFNEVRAKRPGSTTTAASLSRSVCTALQ